MPFARRSTKVLKAATGRELYVCYKEMSRTAGVKRPNESHKARARWKMKAPNDRERISMIQDAKTTFWEEIKSHWNCGKST